MHAVTFYSLTALREASGRELSVKNQTCSVLEIFDDCRLGVLNAAGHPLLPRIPFPASRESRNLHVLTDISENKPRQRFRWEPNLHNSVDTRNQNQVKTRASSVRVSQIGPGGTLSRKFKKCACREDPFQRSHFVCKSPNALVDSTQVRSRETAAQGV